MDLEVGNWKRVGEVEGLVGGVWWEYWKIDKARKEEHHRLYVMSTEYSGPQRSRHVFPHL